MRVVLLEAADAREAREGARVLVAVEDAKVGVAQGEVAVGAEEVLVVKERRKEAKRRRKSIGNHDWIHEIIRYKYTQVDMISYHPSRHT